MTKSTNFITAISAQSDNIVTVPQNRAEGRNTMKVKNYDYPDYKTARQWAKQGFLPTEEAKGIELWANRSYKDKFIYYSPEEVVKATDEQLYEFFRPERERRNRKARARRERQKAERQAEIERESKLEQQRISKLHKIINATNTPSRSEGKTIVIDTETTGLDPFEDELLQVSIISVDGETLYDSFIKPKTESWEDAERINGITPEMVANAPSIEDEIPKINAIICGAKEIIGYNVYFDLDFLRHNGLILEEDVAIVDVMEIFALIYGEYNYYYKNYKWQKLTTAAAYYHYDWSAHGSAHNSLADCYATLHVYKNIKQEDY